MAVLAELRYPTTRLAKIFSGLLALFLFCFVCVAVISGFQLYQILKPARNATSLDLNIMMGHPTVFSFNTPAGPAREGWFFPGLRGAPTIIVCHGYLSQRADVLTLVTALQEHQFNVFLFDFLGHGSAPGITTLGYRETRELTAAVQALGARDDVDRRRFGLWGVDMGAYAVLEVATSDPRIAALAVESPYADPREKVRIEVAHSGLSVIPFVARFCDFGFRSINYSYRRQPAVTDSLLRLKGIPKLFIQADDRPALAETTLRLFLVSPDPKQFVREKYSYADMSDEDRRAHENLVVTFFLEAIPPKASLAR